MKVTPRMIEALRVLSGAPHEGWAPAAFATHLWGRDKHWSRGNGPWGLGPDASGRHGGRMLNRLRAAGLAHFRHEYGYYTATISQRGRDLLAQQSADPVRCPKCGGPHPFHDPACVVHPDLIQNQSGTGAE